MARAQVLLDLAAQVRALTAPDRGVDADVHLALFGGKKGVELGLKAAVAAQQFYTDPDTGNELLSPFLFTFAVEFAERALPGPEWPEWQITRRFCTGYHANVGLGDDGPGCETAAIALLDAALRARAAQGGSDA